MKLIIENTLYLDAVVDLTSIHDDMQDTTDEFNEIADICKRYSINYMLDLREDTTIFAVYPQKITLNEVNMNHVFANILYLFTYKIQYAWLGGEGCEFSMSLTAES